jgi:hypothetical protein
LDSVDSLIDFDEAFNNADPKMTSFFPRITNLDEADQLSTAWIKKYIFAHGSSVDRSGRRKVELFACGLGMGDA